MPQYPHELQAAGAGDCASYVLLRGVAFFFVVTFL